MLGGDIATQELFKALCLKRWFRSPTGHTASMFIRVEYRKKKLSHLHFFAKSLLNNFLVWRSSSSMIKRTVAMASLLGYGCRSVAISRREMSV
jgi:hypothetical protein